MGNSAYVIRKTVLTYKDNGKITSNQSYYGVVGVFSKYPIVMTSKLLNETIYHTKDELDRVMDILTAKFYNNPDNPLEIVEVKHKSYDHKKHTNPA